MSVQSEPAGPPTTRAPAVRDIRAGYRLITGLASKHLVLVGLCCGFLAFFASGAIPGYRLFLVGQLALDITITVGMTILMGATGLLSLASAGFLGLGAYGTVILMVHWKLPGLLALVLALVAGGLVGWLMGFVTLRLSGFQLAIVTLGALQVFGAGLAYGGALTGGGYGLTVPPLTVPGIGTFTEAGIAQICVLVAVITLIGAVSVMRSRVGRAWLALRDNEPAAAMQGIDVRRMKLLAFVTSSALISLAGGLQAFALGVASPGSYVVDVSIFQIALVVVGGMTGGLIGAVVAPVLLYYIPASLGDLGSWSQFFYAGVLLVALIVMREGVSGAVRAAVERVRGYGRLR